MVTLGMAWHGPVGFHFQCVIIVQPCCAYVILGECNKLRMNAPVLLQLVTNMAVLLCTPLLSYVYIRM